MITGAHVIVYSKNAAADLDFVRDVLGFPHVDVGGGWLIFALPPAEVAVHPSGDNSKHELYLMCDDVHAQIKDLAAKGVSCSAVQEERWGTLTNINLPGGGILGLYQPKHESPKHAAASKKKAAPSKKATPKKKAAPKKTKKAKKSAPAKAAKKTKRR